MVGTRVQQDGRLIQGRNWFTARRPPTRGAANCWGQWKACKYAPVAVSWKNRVRGVSRIRDRPRCYSRVKQDGRRAVGRSRPETLIPLQAAKDGYHRQGLACGWAQEPAPSEGQARGGL